MTTKTRNGLQRTVYDVVVHANEGLAVLDIMNRLRVLGQPADRGHINMLLKELVDAGMLQRRLATADEVKLLNVNPGIPKQPYVYSPSNIDRPLVTQRPRAQRKQQRSKPVPAPQAKVKVKTQARPEKLQARDSKPAPMTGTSKAIEALRAENAELRALVKSLASIISKSAG